MSSGFQLVSEDLRAHSVHLDGLVDRLNQVVSAASSVSVDSSAYGILCAFLPPVVNATTQQRASDTIGAAVKGMASTADNIRTAAASYAQQDQNAAAPFEGVDLNNVGPGLVRPTPNPS